ncbi:hypothetical protein V3468_05945 [Flavobacterium oreochromis]|uniref:hypothetical protein n=1 Tax=Flavobacterium oreochromis TaxID=2906078 RepID=UPI00385A2700
MNNSVKFNYFFKHKGNIGPICEKACRNFKFITQIQPQTAQNNTQNSNTVLKERIHHRLFYFTLGHKYKTIATKSLFDYQYNEDQKKDVPHNFLSLQSENIDFWDDFYSYDQNFKEKGLLNDIRNINSHFIHDFNALNMDSTSFFNNQKNKFENFIEEAFLLSSIANYCEEKKIQQENFYDDKEVNHLKGLVVFLQEKFFPKENLNNTISEIEKELEKTDLNDDDKQKKQSKLAELTTIIENIDAFARLNYKEAIKELLYINVKTDFDFEIDNEPAFTITKGTYLSYNATLFIVSLFLYKDEASKLVSKIQGFKKTKTQEERKKPTIITFFSKKPSSQDIDNDEKQLTKFRDIIQYLDKYPTAWNSEMKFASLKVEENAKKAVPYLPENKTGIMFPKMTNALVEIIFEKELVKTYLTKSDSKEQNKIDTFKENIKDQDLLRKDFIDYCKDLFIYKDKRSEKRIDKKWLTKLDNFIFIPKEIQDAKTKKELLSVNYKKNEKEINKQKSKIRKFKKADNQKAPTTEKLEKRIKENTFLISNGRNQERFLEFATHFLASQNYFGKDALFKCYATQTTEENEELKKQQNASLTKKEFDKLKYHHGRLVDFVTYDTVKTWDNPFVFENNAISIKIKTSTETLLIPISKNLIIYFLENAFYLLNDKRLPNIEGKGKNVLLDYFNIYKSNFDKQIQLIETNNFQKEDKNTLSKYLPKRLLQNVYAENRNANNNALEKLLLETQQQENRYKKLLELAKENGVLADFEKKNKGKQFKLRFMKKAWNLMYFKAIYKENKGEDLTNHHKHFHITREEFNDFSRFLFAFDLPHYKENLKILLDAKDFFRNQEFAQLFNNANSFEQLYDKTKEKYTHWLTTPSPFKEDSYKLENYAFIKDFKALINAQIPQFMLVINLSQFLDFLKSRPNDYLKVENGKLVFTTLVNNEEHLNDKWYNPIELNNEEQKSYRYLTKKLFKAKLEDCFLYEIAFSYIKQEHITLPKKSINTILQESIIIPVNKKDNSTILYNIEVPFKHLESFERILVFKKEQEDIYKLPSFFEKIPEYLKTIKEEYFQDTVQLKTSKPMIGIANKLLKNNKTISFDEYKKVESHLLTTSNKFSRVLMEMEGYFCVKQENGTSILQNEKSKNTFINFDIYKNHFNPYQLGRMRNAAFHFLIPSGVSYVKKLIEIEEKFIEEEIVNANLDVSSLVTFYDIPIKRIREVLTALKDTLHDDLFAKAKKSLNEEEQKSNRLVRRKEEEMYIDSMIKSKATTL